MLLYAILAISSLLQLIAALLALRIGKNSQIRAGWMIIAIGLLFMGVRRALALYSLPGEESIPTGTFIIESIALLISMVVLTGVAIIGRSFERLAASEAHWRLSEQRHRHLLQNLRDGVAATSNDGKITIVNPTFCEMLGYTEAELLGKTVSEITPEKWHRVEREFVFEQIEQKGYSDTFEKEYIAKDGSIIPVEIRVYKQKDNDDGNSGYWALCRDIRERKRHLEALSRSEERFAIFMENLPAGVFIKNRDGRYVYTNRYFQELTNRESGTGSSSNDLFEPETADSQHRKDQEAFRERQLVTTDSVRDFEGISRIFETHRFTIPMEDDDTLLGGVMVEVTEKVRAERERDALSKLAIDLVEKESPNEIGPSIARAVKGFIEFDSFFFSQRMLESPDYFVLAYWSDLIGGKQVEECHPSDTKLAYSVIPELLEGKPMLIHRDGPPGPGWRGFGDTKRHSRSLLYAPVVMRGKVYGIISAQSYDSYRYHEDDLDILQSIAEIVAPALRRCLLEEKLKASELHMRTLINAIPEVIWLEDSESRILWINRAALQLLNLEEKDVFGKHASRLQDHAPSIQRMSQSLALAEEDMARQDVELILSDGSMAIMDVIRVAIVGKDGNRRGTLTVARDVTETRQEAEMRRELEAQVQQAQKLESLGILAGGIAHDFNNLLMAILGNAGLALEDLPPESPANQSLQEIELAAKRAADLCRQMLAYSGKGRFVIEPVDIRHVVEEMTHLLEVSISKRVVLKFRFAEQIPPTLADVTQMRQIVMNLITNASEAIGEKSGVISITTGVIECDEKYLQTMWLKEKLPPGLYVYMEVADTGSGMSEETQAHMFDPFFTTKTMGRGLGMAAVLGIVRGHKGAIKVYSEVNRGTTIRVLFPAAVGEELLPDKNVARSPRIAETGSILIIDDEQSVRILGKRMLEREGFVVYTAEDGVVGLEMYQKYQSEITCVLLDLTMPRMGGEETYRELRRIRNDLPIILSSGYNENEVRERFAGRKIEGFIQKPYQRLNLIAEIDRVLRECEKR